VAKRKTGLGVDAFFPEEEFEVKTTSKVKPSASQRSPRRRRNTIKSKSSGSGAKPETGSKIDQDERIERRPAWIRIDHLEKLDILKHRERRRLHREKKRVARSTLIDEAIEFYLAQMEK
jgi:hypothetical protein